MPHRTPREPVTTGTNPATRVLFPSFALDGDLSCSPSDHDMFFPPIKTPPQRAKKLCRSCDARDACLRWAITREEDDGIWGGFTPRERRDIANRPNWRAYTAAQLEQVIKDTTPSPS